MTNSTHGDVKIMPFFAIELTSFFFLYVEAIKKIHESIQDLGGK